MTKILVTGGTGFIGSHIIDYFSSNGRVEIYALVRDINNLKWLKDINVQFLEGDLLSLPSLPPDVDYVFHIAGCTKAHKLADYTKTNKEGTANLIQSLYSQKIALKKFIYLSSLGVSGPSFNGKPVNECDPPCPLTPYGKSKLQGEIEALKFKNEFPIIILRPGGVYGPRDKDFLHYFKLIKKGILPAFDSNQRLVCLCYVKDLVRAFELCVRKEIESGSIFHIADPKPYSWDEFGQAAARVLRSKLKKVIIPRPAAYLVALVSEVMSKINKSLSIIDRNKLIELKQTSWIADVGEAADELSFYPQYLLQEAIQETIDWYLEQGWL